MVTNETVRKLLKAQILLKQKQRVLQYVMRLNRTLLEFRSAAENNHFAHSDRIQADTCYDCERYFERMSLALWRGR